LLHASATHDKERNTVTVFVVNRDPADEISTDIVCQNGFWGSSCEVREINGPALNAINSYENKNAVCTVTKTIPIGPKSDVFPYVFPAHSVTALTLALEADDH